MDPSSDTKKPNSIRNRIIEVIAFAHKHKLLAWINTPNPLQAAQKIDSWLKKQPWTATDSQFKITSHSFRKNTSCRNSYSVFGNLCKQADGDNALFT